MSNRLPITIHQSESSGNYEFYMSSGGLVSGLAGLSKSACFKWFGWPGQEVQPDQVEPVEKTLKDKFNAIPVFLDDELADRHYNGFSSMYVYT